MNTVGPAFPCTQAVAETEWLNGLTKREYAAIHIMAGLAASGQLLSHGDCYCAAEAARAADALFNQFAEDAR